MGIQICRLFWIELEKHRSFLRKTSANIEAVALYPKVCLSFELKT